LASVINKLDISGVRVVVRHGNSSSCGKAITFDEYSMGKRQGCECKSNCASILPKEVNYSGWVSAVRDRCNGKRIIIAEKPSPVIVPDVPNSFKGQKRPETRIEGVLWETAMGLLQQMLLLGSGIIPEKKLGTRSYSTTHPDAHLEHELIISKPLAQILTLGTSQSYPSILKLTQLHSATHSDAPLGHESLISG
ncbi:hypothetical protein HAX54_039011, partial [Datura stramonium]|nr:hypothetical protein [Datura stramonium]